MNNKTKELFRKALPNGVRHFFLKSGFARILRQAGWSGVDFLKLDVQGYEMKILKGGGDILDRVEFILLEASLQPLNAGAPLVDEILTFMRARGFLMYDICSFSRRPPQRLLSQIDLLMVRETSKFSPTRT